MTTTAPRAMSRSSAICRSVAAGVLAVVVLGPLSALPAPVSSVPSGDLEAVPTQTVGPTPDDVAPAYQGKP